jgi:hypothetical protein
LAARVHTAAGGIVLVADSVEVKDAWLADLQLSINEANDALL